MGNPLLQEHSMDVIYFPMPEKKKDTRKRARKLIEMPEWGPEVWKEVRVASVRRGVPIGTLLLELARKEFCPLDKPRPKQ